MADYTCRSQQRILKALTEMAGREIEGISPGELAKLTGMSATQVTATLANLEIAGWAYKANERWRITPFPVKIFQKVAENFEKARIRFLEIEDYYMNSDRYERSQKISGSLGD